MKKKTILILNGREIPGDDLKVQLHRLGYEVSMERDESLGLSLAQMCRSLGRGFQ
jgi:hypothetical protein